MKTIKLGNEVVVSDPCYDLPTWCQAVVKNVLPGNYRTLVVKNDEGDWGIRCSRLIAIHEDYAHQDEKFRWSRYPASIGVDSGQAGIFSIETYRKDELAEQMGQGDGEGFGSGWATEEGDKWYERICTRTLGKEQWGTYSEGVVSSSGIGDGSYELLVATKKNKVVGFTINFFLDNRSNKKVVNEEFLTRV